MTGLLNGYLKKIVARQGLASQVPTLNVAEIGYDVDTKFGRIGDGTSTPPRFPTSKSTGEVSFPSVTKMTWGGVVLTAGGHINGVTLSALNLTAGVLRRTTLGAIGRAVFISADSSIDINNPDGSNDGAIDLALNMDTIESHLDLNNLPFVKRSGDTMSGALKLPAISIVSDIVADRREVTQTAAADRWATGADDSAELGNNSGSNWRVSRYSDAGTKIDDPLSVNRASGMIELKHGIILPDGTPWSRGKELPKDAVGYLYNDGVGNLSWRLVATVQVFPTSILNPVQGTAYSTQFTATGGSGTYTFTRTAGTLPTGLSLTTAGVLSGTPTVPGSFTFTITANDGAGLTGARAYTIVVAANAGIYSILPAALPNASQGMLYAAQLSASGSYAAPVAYAITSGALPSGLEMSSAGAITGTPTVNGNFSFVVQATDAAGAKANITYILSVAANQFVFHISYDADNINLFDFAGQPAYAGNFEFIVDGGVTVRSVSADLPALRTGVFGSGCTIKLTNRGSIHGMGGMGGVGGPLGDSRASEYPSEVSAMTGKNGGTAVQLDMPLILDNTNGRIFGGGGGGAGGAESVSTSGYLTLYAPGGGGGGGQGAYTSSGGPAGAGQNVSSGGFSPAASGTPGGYSMPGMGGQGGYAFGYDGGVAAGLAGASGGQWGQAGGYIVVVGGPSGHIYPGGSLSGTLYGGAAGSSVKTGSYALTWLGSGNNSNQVKGPIT